MRILLTIALLLSPISAQAQPGDEVGEVIEVTWKGRAYKGNELPEKAGEASAEAVATWTPWCLEHEYQMHLVSDSRVLLITPEGSNQLSKQLKLVEQTQKEFDKILPAPPREDLNAAAEPEPEDELPEDPEGGPVGFAPVGQQPVAFSFTTSWGAGTWPVDSETCVMFVVRNEREYGSLVKTLGKMEDYLKHWVAQGLNHTGFVHEKPLVGAYIQMASGMEEWDPNNEMVHRIAHLLFVRRFSSIQPNWAIAGVSWYLENLIRDAIYVYPFRSEFVFATEHTAWQRDLKNIFEGRGSSPLEIYELTEWKRGTYEGTAARLSYGFSEFLSKYRTKQLSLFFEGLRMFAMEDSKEYTDDVNWTRKPNYSVSAENQAALIIEHFGDFAMLDAADYFRKGKKYKPKKRKLAKK